jgi:predicted DNA-binding transcriptional regulator AlpA
LHAAIPGRADAREWGSPSNTNPSVRRQRWCTSQVNLVGVAEIHDLLLEISRDGVLDLTYRDDFPTPAAELGAGDIWDRAEVEQWIAQHGDLLLSLFKAGL